MSLYLQYRPTSFEAVKGNENIVATLSTMLSKKNHPHVYLLHGPTGCGKTTIARIIGAQLGCKGADFREINCSDFNGIDTIREINKNSHYMPMEGPVRIWLIDEVHQMTIPAQNGFLKILEDTPPHVYFILCTTDPQKLLATIRGRCSEFQVQVLSELQMKGLLRSIVKAEGQTLTSEIYEQIIQDSLGHPRNAIQTLEQVLNAEPEMRLEVAMKAAELQSQSIELSRVLVKPKASWKEVRTILLQLKGQEPEEIRRSVIGYCSAILLKSENDRAGLVLENFIEPFYNSGFPGLVLASYLTIKS